MKNKKHMKKFLQLFNFFAISGVSREVHVDQTKVEKY
jgi:hypothetical protein